MSKLAALHKHLCEKLHGYVHSKKIHATQTGGKIDTSSSEWLGYDGGIRIAGWRYQAGILIENFPHHKLDPKVLFALIAIFLSEHDKDRELADPEIQIDVNNEESADVLILIEFEEPIELVPDHDGLIQLGDETYSTGEPEIWIAETFELDVEVKFESENLD